MVSPTGPKEEMGMRRRLVPAVLALIAVLTLAGASASAAAGRTSSVDLTGEAEVTAEGVPNQGDLDGSGTATISINRGQGEICWTIDVEDITLPAIAAHIHVGASTTTGPVVVTLTPPDEEGTSSGCTTVDRELAKAIAKNPDAYYVNVHTTDFPAGALRGQLG
jgi:hypothetical protein